MDEIAPHGELPVEFLDSKQLEAWLTNQPRELAIAIAARKALRVVPLVTMRIPNAERDFLNLSATVFRATALAWVAAKYPTRANELRDAAGRAALAAEQYGIPYGDAAARAAHAAFSAAFTAAGGNIALGADAAADAASAVYGVGATFFAASASAARTTIVSAISADASILASGGTASALASEPLWPEGAPDWAGEHWRRLRRALPAEDGWQVWIDWYQKRVDGVLDAEEIELVYAKVPEEEWNKGPAAANRWINERLAELDQKKAPPAWDFFISHSALDEAVAREIAAVLEDAGHSTYAQFKDIAPGNNFVREMQRGLTGSSRVVALYSPEYENSDHCQAEWSAAYNSDPSGKRRKLVPFLLRPTALNSLARQVVYKSLIGLSKAERKRAILEAIAPKPTKRAIGEIHATLAETASPQPSVNEDGKLDAGPNKIFDRPLVDHDLVELPYSQREIIKTILRALPGQAPPIVGSALQSYAEHLQDRGSQPIVRLLGDFRAAIEKEFRAPDVEFWGSGLRELFERFFRKDALFETHFPLKNEESFADIPIDEANATGVALIKPMQGVAEKMDTAVAAGLATEGLGKITSNSARFAEDIAPLPPDESSFEPGSRRVTLKRRYVLGTLGFLVALYNVMGSTASIVATAQGAALLQAVRQAIESLSKFLLI